MQTTPIFTDQEAKDIENAYWTMRAIRHKLRRLILTILKNQERITVTELYITLRIEQSIVSQHLAILRRTGFVTTERQGKHIYYSVNEERLRHVLKLAESMAFVKNAPR